MKNILVFGAGERGKKLTDQYIEYAGTHKICALVDNNPSADDYHGIPMIQPRKIAEFDYDEIWVCTIYYPQVKKQLIEEYHIDENRILYVEPVIPVLEERIRKKYEAAATENRTNDLSEVLAYIKEHPVHMYCYPFYDEYIHRDTPVCYDEEKHLYYVLHHSQKMYFSKKMDTEQKVRNYYNAVVMEQDARSPHCYWSGSCMKNIFGVCVDVGAAEGIFALEIIERVEHIYLIEVDEDWIEALTYTFEPFKEKVTIVRKFITDKNCGAFTTLDRLFDGTRVDFIKMDIEGEEYKALQGANGLLQNQNPRLAVCVYHHQDDNHTIGTWLRDKGYQVENSSGYILCQGEWELDKDETDFRKGLIFAEKAADSGDKR